MIEESLILQFKDALQGGKYDLALSIIEFHDKETLRSLWYNSEIPPDIKHSNKTFGQYIDAQVWIQLSKKLHQNYWGSMLWGSSFIFIGFVLVFWLLVESYPLIRYGKVSEGIPEILHLFLIVPILMFFYLGINTVINIKKWLNEIQIEAKKQK